MAFLIPLYLSLITFTGLYSPLSVFESDECPKYTQGYVRNGRVTICPDNLTMPRQEVINHEVIHLIQSNLGVDTLLPTSAVSYLVNTQMSEAETLSVLVVYSDSGYMMSEFEARLLQKMPEPLIMTMYRLSQDYAFLTTRYNLSLHV
jgi:hypothetical protein